MYNFNDPKNKPIVITKKKITIELSVGIGAYNPDETRAKPKLIEYYHNGNAWLKYDSHWYLIKYSNKFNNLQDIKSYFDKNCYTEEQFLEKILDLILNDKERKYI